MTLNFEIFYIFFLKIDKQIQKPLRQAQLNICCISISIVILNIPLTIY